MYTIKNPYEGVNWDTFLACKAQLHAHTTYSDGNMALSDVVEAYYALGYHILAIADHGVVGRGWVNAPKTVPLLGMQKRRAKREMLSPKRVAQIRGGEGREDCRGMIPVRAIEMNGCVIHKNHVNGFFADYGQSYWGRDNDFETVVKGMQAAGGLSHLNHLGDWIKSGNDISRARDPKYIKLFSDIFLKYPSCVGMEIVNRIDSVTKHDRVLWDELLKTVIPKGRCIWGFANDDSHCLTDIGLTGTVFMLQNNNAAEVRRAMEKGSFFAVARQARYEIGDTFKGEGDMPEVRRITVDEAAGGIALERANCDKVEWVSGGEIIAEGDTLNLGEHGDSLSCYVRAQLRGAGGMLFTQPFVLLEIATEG